MPTPPQGRGIGDDDGDELVQVAYGNDPVEVQMIQGLLESGGRLRIFMPLRLK